LPNGLSPKMDVEGHLSLDSESGFSQGHLHRSRIDRLRKPRPQRAVDLVEARNDLFGQLAMKERHDIPQNVPVVFRIVRKLRVTNSAETRRDQNPIIATDIEFLRDTL